jgi:hypothetical protein
MRIGAVEIFAKFSGVGIIWGEKQGKTLQTLHNTPPPDIHHHRMDINNVLSHTPPRRLALIMSRNVDSPPPLALSQPYLNNVLGFTTTEGILV